jgi:pimeloyl-ACP methyl ester carboxylesterase
MHGWGCRRETLASIEREVRALGRPLINVDFPGFGRSQEPPEVWGIERYTQSIEALLQMEGVGDDAVLLGHSFGGRVGILYASRHHVGKLVLVDAAGVKPRRSLRYYVKVYTFKAQKRLMYLLLGRERAEARLDRLRAKAGSSDYANSTPRMRAILSKVVNEDLTSVMPSITAPTLLIWGENDTATPLRDARTMERLIPGAGLVSFPGCGHYSFLDNPSQFAAVLRSFLQS